MSRPDGLGPTVRDGMALACRPCRHRFPEDVTVGVLAAHFETAHGTTDVQLDLVVVCPRCDAEMTFERAERRRDVFACAPCHRTRIVHRKEP